VVIETIHHGLPRSARDKLKESALKTLVFSHSIDGYLDRKPEFAGKPRTINPGGRCTKGAGGKPQTPSECKKAPTGARVGGKEGWNWEKISSEHPMKAQVRQRSFPHLIHYK
jgi:hypothetical protein